ncbi:Tat (twin-arginine translocation) pathway signal sequence containing protein [Pedobacter sp. Leaf216]|uniref:ferritin-like domain-containing protein n=1 Tax=Pedobacter sp. Leaf216 TaxID=1735684 RepID=UPI0006FD66C2|nr:ferritin-like domain-containing protein [Pedobacter sp. Leaf216]KQM77172.1 Tat (twin-arginine translocation) pathway signal sequence containing protein [Pedobacter sp. Leaf216]
MTKSNSEANAEKDSFSASMRRRQFLQFTGASAIAVGLIGCKKDKPAEFEAAYVNTDNTIDFKDDAGLLNYIYALEQLEAAFYVKAAESLPTSFTATQILFFNDIKLHEIAHREFFKRILGTTAIGNLTVDFSSINFADATAVLNTAKTFEDLGVAAYNDAISRCKNDYNLFILSQIATVEARHAAYVRSQIDALSFADLNELAPLGADAGSALDVSLAPGKVLEQALKYIKTKLTIINL